MHTLRQTLRCAGSSGRWSTSLLILALGMIFGCEPPKIDPQARSNGGPPEPMYAKASPAAEAAPNTDGPEEKRPPRVAPSAPPNKTMKLDRLKPQDATGDGTLGDLILIPLRTYSKVRVTIDDIQIKSQLNIFRATNGGKPKDFAEYKKEILDPINLQLPELPPGDRYLYLPDQGRDGEVVIGSPVKKQ